MTKKILITGAGGFIGKNLTRTLSDNYSVVTRSRKQLNLLDREKVSIFLKEYKFDVVIHTATYDAAPAFSTNNPDKVLEYNLRMFDNLSQHNRDYGMMIYFGSGAEWRREKPYGLSKYVMDQITQNKDNIYNLRLYSVYGVGTDWRYRFINNACAKTALRLPIKIPRINKCDYLHINDLCQIVEFYIHNFKAIPKSRDICSGDVLSTEEIVNYIKNIVPICDTIPFNEVSSTVSRAPSCGESYFGHPDFVSSLPITLTPIGEGIRELLEFYETYPPNPNEFVY
jgi:GDP-L-fucose synthase